MLERKLEVSKLYVSSHLLDPQITQIKCCKTEMQNYSNSFLLSRGKKHYRRPFLANKKEYKLIKQRNLKGTQKAQKHIRHF